MSYIRWFDDLGIEDVPIVGGKNASLGEMTCALASAGIPVPEGFATTADGYRRFVTDNALGPPIDDALEALNGGAPLDEIGARIRALFMDATLPADIAEEIRAAYAALCDRAGRAEVDVAVRSSATAEDLPDASFAGQQESYLNVVGEAALLEACKRCMASLFTDRAITYRAERGFVHQQVALSVGVQRMVRSDLASAGVMFSLDTESGFPGVVEITGAWGLGENVVQGAVGPDEFTVCKALLEDPGKIPILDRRLGEKELTMRYDPAGGIVNHVTPPEQQARFTLSDAEVLQLARWALRIEAHYGRPMDIEWAKDGEDQGLYIVQARPETVHARRGAGSIKTYTLLEEATPLVSGAAIGEAIVCAPVCRILGVEQLGSFRPGSILVTEMTDPDWGPILKQAAGIITDHGGRTCHAAIVSRELGIPAIVGSHDATQVLSDGQEVTLCCSGAEEGRVYAGALAFEETEVQLAEAPATRTEVMLNIASPSAAFHWWRLPTDGVGLARMEFIINNSVRVHPMALVRFDEVPDPAARAEIERLTAGYTRRGDYFVERLAAGIGRIAAVHYPKPVILRMSDFKTDEYANLLGGQAFEPREDNPMLGFRGASRYYSEAYRPGFQLECEAVRAVREKMGLDNVVVMIPFCRTLEEADRVLEVMAESGLRRGVDGLQVYVMCEIPSNVILAEQFAERFDGFSIGSNDLTQLTLGIDRNSAELAELFDERNPAVKALIAQVVERAHACGAKVGICGQAPSDYPEFAEFLVRLGIDSISLTPDRVVPTRAVVAAAEAAL